MVIDFHVEKLMCLTTVCEQLMVSLNVNVISVYFVAGNLNYKLISISKLNILD